jgi:class 3 adenylate cyclase/tetratricopeptide (TPR) repeat protein
MGPASPIPRAYTPPHLAEKVLTSRGALEGERKLVTVLFCDLANSTELAARVGPEGMHALLDQFFELALAEIHRYEGTVNQFLGDGLMALFGAPVAHEDHARRAVLAALAIAQRLASARLDGGGEPVELQVRMGLNTGLVVVGRIGDNLRMDYTAVGETTHLAARLQQLAEPGTIVVSDAVAQLVQREVRLEARPPVRVKGKADPVRVHRVLGLVPRGTAAVGLGERPLVRFVGRQAELERLEALLRRVDAGQGQAVGLSGDPGVGKSRLLFEFRARLPGDVRYLEGRCLSYGSTVPYLPVLDVLRQFCGLTETDTPESAVAKVRAALEDVSLDPEGEAPYLLRALGLKDDLHRLERLSPEAIRLGTFDTLRQLVLRRSRRQRLVLAIENLHWIDRTSEAWLGTLVDHLPGAGILLLATYRTGYRPPWPEQAHVTELTLGPLGTEESVAMIESLRAQQPIADPLVPVVLAKAEGNPLFLEELVRAVGGEPEPASTFAVPDTVQGVLTARIDRLPDELKAVLQAASVLEREFSAELLAAMWPDPERLPSLIEELVRWGFLEARPRDGAPRYAFSNALMQEVVLASLLTTRRQALHAAAGRALERLYAGRLEEAHERLAHHFARSDAPQKAVEYLSRVADQAARAYAHSEAVGALEEARRHAARIFDEGHEARLLELTLRQAASLYFLGQQEAVLALLGPHEAQVAALDEPRLAGQFYFLVGRAHNLMGDRDKAVRYQRRALTQAERAGDEVTMGQAHFALGYEAFVGGRPAEGVELGRRAVAHLERTTDRWWLGMAHWMVGLNHFLAGDLSNAVADADQTRAIGETMGDARLQSYAAGLTAWVHTARRETAAALSAGERAQRLAPDPFCLALAVGALGWAYLDEDPARALPLLEQVVNWTRQFRVVQMHSLYLAFLAEAQLATGQPDQARASARESLAVAQDTDYLEGLGSARRALGRVALAEGDLPEALRQLEGARQTFAAIPARLRLAETLVPLAEATHARGDRAGAAKLLGEARALFDQLGAPRAVERTLARAAALGLAL